MAAPPGCRQCKLPDCGTWVPVRNFAQHQRECRKRDRESSSDGDSSSGGGDQPVAALAEDSRADDVSPEQCDAAEDDAALSDAALSDATPSAALPPDDPGLLPADERRRRLLRWTLQNPQLDPRVRFGEFDWGQMETIIDARMSEAIARDTLDRLHERGAASLGLTLRTRNDASPCDDR